MLTKLIKKLRIFIDVTMIILVKKIMAKVDYLIPFILKWEGGYVNDPLDKGGATNKGITLRTFTEHRTAKGKTASIEQLKNISHSEWREIMKRLYWDRWQADSIENQSIANILVDWVWASGVWGIKIPQRIMRLTQDGIVGAETVLSVNSANQQQLFQKILTARLKFIDDIIRKTPSQKRFERGWKSRINEFTFTPSES